MSTRESPRRFTTPLAILMGSALLVTTGKIGARISNLDPLLKAGHQGVTLSAQDLRTIAMWLDLNSDMFSDDLQRDAQASGQSVKPSLE